MFVKKNKSWKGTLLTFTVGYRENGKVKHKNIETIGYLEDLKKQYDDPIAHFKEIAKQRSNSEINELVIKNLSSKKIDSLDKQKNLGYVFLKKIYNELGLKDFLKAKQADTKIEYNLNDILSLLVYSRILYPGSKKETYNGKDRFFDKYDFSEKDMYRSLDYFSEYKEEIQTLLWNNTKEKYNRDISNAYYDCTNYYFEINYNDTDLIDEEGNILEKKYRKRGPEKNHRPDPIVEMGLLMDNSGLPLSYDLFPGNESEKLSLRPILKRTKSKFGIEKVIVVADRGLNTADNTFFLAGKNDDDHKNHDGYVYGQSVRGADKEFKNWVLTQKDYKSDKIYDKQGNEEMYRAMIFNENGIFDHYEKKPVIFKHKSRMFAKEVYVNTSNGKKKKAITYQKQMAYYSQKYADKQKRDRQIMIEKAKDLINNPGKYTRATSYGSAAYVNNIKFDKTTGAISNATSLSLNIEKIKEEEKYDGYYSIVTSELNMSDEKMRDTYRGLAKIEDSFKITKSLLNGRPVFVWTTEHIEAHFLTCFISLLIVRLLEKKTDNKYSIGKMIESIKKYSSSKIEHDIYLQSYIDDVITDLSGLYDVDFTRKYLSLSEIKKILND